MTVILLHGLGQDKSSWHEVKACLQTDEVCCLDVFPPHQSTSLDYQALYQAFNCFCQKSEGQLDLVGLSLGGVLALHYAIDCPEKVRSLVLINTQYRMPALVLTLQNMVFRLLPNKAFAGLGLPKSDMIRLCHSMKNLDFTTSLKQVSIPTLVISGEKDRINRQASKRFSQLLRNARLEVVSGGGHVLNRDKPRELADLINAFYQTLS